MLNFISFGSGSSGNCYYLYTESDGVLIDAGVGIRTIKKHFFNYGLSLKNVRNIIITHDHADHVKSVGYLSTEFGLPVYGTQKVHDGINRNYCVRKKIKDEYVKVIEPRNDYQIGEFVVTPFYVPHDSSDNVGYRIIYQDTVFCLITDAGHVTEEMGKYIGEADYLVFEANHDVEMLKNGPYSPFLKSRVSGLEGHLSNIDCANALASYASPKLKHVWLCHLSEENNHPILAEKTIKTIVEESSSNGKVPYTIEVLKRKIPCEIEMLK